VSRQLSENVIQAPDNIMKNKLVLVMCNENIVPSISVANEQNDIKIFAIEGKYDNPTAVIELGMNMLTDIRTNVTNVTD